MIYVYPIFVLIPGLFVSCLWVNFRSCRFEYHLIITNKFAGFGSPKLLILIYFILSLLKITTNSTCLLYFIWFLWALMFVVQACSGRIRLNFPLSQTKPRLVVVHTCCDICLGYYTGKERNPFLAERKKETPTM